jgi:folate-dependent phosphoribosylglycinamide formyltransferase PurN
MLQTVALCKRLRDAHEISKSTRAMEGATLSLLVTRTRAVPLFIAALVVDLVRMGPYGWRDVVALVRHRRVRITLRALGDDKTVTLVRSLSPDVGLHATPIIYRRKLIDSFRLGILNAHIGLLPRYRGRSVMEWAILHGDPTGITTFFIDEGIDTGSRIVLRRKISVSGFNDIRSAKGYLFSLAGEMYREALEKLHQPDFAFDRQQVSDGTRWYVMSRLFSGVVEGLLSVGAVGGEHSELRRCLLEQALERRLAEVRAMTDAPTAAGHRSEAHEGAEAEELLRVLMVRLWPRVDRGAGSEDDLLAFFAHLRDLRGSAEGTDIRFLDAFNCAYEAVSSTRWREADSRQLRQQFLIDYASLLERRVVTYDHAAPEVTRRIV